MSSTFHCAGCSNQNGMPDLFCNPVFTSSSSPTILMSSVLFSEARVAVEGKLPVVPETILKRRKWEEENRDLRAREAVKSKVVFKMKKA